MFKFMILESNFKMKHYLIIFFNLFVVSIFSQNINKELYNQYLRADSLGKYYSFDKADSILNIIIDKLRKSNSIQ